MHEGFTKKENVGYVYIHHDRERDMLKWCYGHDKSIKTSSMEGL